MVTSNQIQITRITVKLKYYMNLGFQILTKII